MINMKIGKICLLAFIMATITACSSMPAGHLDKIAAMSHITGEETVLTRAASFFYPDTYEITVKSITYGENAIAGQILLTNEAVRFIVWREDARMFIPLYEIPFKEISKIKTDTYLGVPYIALQTKDYKFNSFIVYEEKHQEFLNGIHKQKYRYK